MIQSIIINLDPNEHSEEFHYYLFAVKLDRYIGSCNTLNVLSIKYVFQIKQKILNLSVFIIKNIDKAYIMQMQK